MATAAITTTGPPQRGIDAKIGRIVLAITAIWTILNTAVAMAPLSLVLVPLLFSSFSRRAWLTDLLLAAAILFVLTLALWGVI